MVDYSKYPTDKFKCRQCHKNKMYPNQSDNKIMGFVCDYCGCINYPVLDGLKIRKLIINGLVIPY